MLYDIVLYEYVPLRVLVNNTKKSIEHNIRYTDTRQGMVKIRIQK